MNGLTVILVLVAAVVPIFIGVVLFDRWLDEKETRDLIDQARRRQEARDRLAAMYRDNPGAIRLGHHERGDR